MSLIDQITQYIHASRAELMKVSWPSKRDTIRYSALVVGVSIAVAAFFGLLDTGLGKLVQIVVTTRAPAAAIAQPEAPTTESAPSESAPPVTLTPESVEVQSDNGTAKATGIKVVPQPLPSPAPSNKK